MDPKKIIGLIAGTTKNKLPRPIVLNGPSGCGKSTLTNQLMKRFPDLFAFSISHTTRSPRKGEVNGVDYHFISKEQFKQDIEDNKFVEYAEVHGNFYGTSIQSIKDVREKGQIPILDINLDGGQSVVKAKLNPILIFVNAPSWEILERRLTNRGTETKEQIKRRLETAKEEIEWVKNNPKFHHLHLINNLLEDAVDELQETVQSEIDLVTKN
ncbi:guanylate kinase [Anaeramoeba flamelloides]|uniref:guanylate kinase n=1 Tax=Anaeramoeba flamelloides TaxID=1746091 RepID=A0AAV7YB68_9EUKA|nr:guanylate kinase [Anaeramoeba flamelloides]